MRLELEDGRARRRAPIGRKLAALALTLMAGLALTGPAAAADTQPDEGTVRWSVAPADTEGRDGRRVINLDLEPGATTEDRILVENLSSREVTFAITANDGYRTKSGSFDAMPSHHVPEFGGAWIKLPQDSVTLDGGEKIILPFQVEIPENATPGDHIAGVMASIRTEATSQNVAMESRMGVRVNIRVAGEVSAVASVDGVTAEYEMNWNPFAPGRVTLAGDVANSGNIRFVGRLGAEAQGSGPGDVEALEQLEFLPGETRRMTASVEQVWPLGPITVTYRALREVVEAPNGTGNDVTIGEVVGEVTVWAVPWPQLIVLVLLVLLVAAVLLRRRAKRRRLERMLAEARAEGARSVVADAD